MTKKQKIKYVSIKLPSADFNGKYTEEYLKKHGKKLFHILYTSVPARVYEEFIEQIQLNDKKWDVAFQLRDKRMGRA